MTAFPSTTLPLITLQPISDSGQRWVALSLASERPLDSAALNYLFVNCRLSETLDSLSCVVWVDPAAIDATLQAILPAAQMLLSLSPEETLDPALQNLGYRLMTDGLLDKKPALAQGISPSKTPSKSTSSSHGLLLKLLSLVTADADTPEIEAVIKRDPNLSYQLLKLVNSVAFASAGKITNFAQAISLLGRRQLQRWLQLLLYAQSQGNGSASLLLPRAALRAGLMEALAKHAGMQRGQQDHAFMIGMFSLLETLFGTPLAEIITPLNLAEEVVHALIDGSGPLGGLLNVVSTCEAAPSPALAQALATANIQNADWAAVLVEGARWAVQVSKEA